MSIVINWPTKEVVGVLTYLENDIKWRNKRVETRNTPGGSLVGVGATFRLSWGLCNSFPRLYETFKYQPNQAAALKTMSGPLPLTFRRSFERVEGSTRFIIRYERVGFIIRLFLLSKKSRFRQSKVS